MKNEYKLLIYFKQKTFYYRAIIYLARYKKQGDQSRIAD